MSFFVLICLTKYVRRVAAALLSWNLLARYLPIPRLGTN